MQPEPSTTTVIPFTRRHRWRWWVMIAMGTTFLAYGLALLTSPAWAPRGAFGVEGVWLWLRGETYLVFGFMQALVGVGYIRLTYRPAEAVIADGDGITVRRLYGKRHLPWREITTIRKARTSVLLAATPVSFWKLILFDPRVLRLDATIMEATTDELAAMVSHHNPGLTKRQSERTLNE